MPELTIDIRARLAQFQDSINRVERDTGRMVKGIDSAFRSLRAFTGVLAGGAVFTGIANAIRSTASELDALAKASQGAGVTVEALSGLRFAAELSGIAARDMDRALAVLSKRLSDAAKGSGEAAAAFSNLGIDPSQFTSADQALGVLADKFAQLPDGVRKSTLAAQVFGEELGARFIPFLNAGAAGLADMLAEAERLGIVIDTNLAKDAERFNDELSRMNRQLEAITVTLAGPIISRLADVLQFYRAFTSVQGLGSGLASGAATAALAFGDLETAIRSVGEDLAEADEQVRAIAQRLQNPGANPRLVADLRRQLESAREDAERLSAVYASLQRLQLRDLPDPFNPPQPPAARADPAAQAESRQSAQRLSDGQRLIQQLQSRLDAMNDLTAVEQLSLDIARERVALTPAERAQAESIAERIDAMRAEAEMQRIISDAQRTAAAEEAQAAADRQAAVAALARDAEQFKDFADPLRDIFRQVDRVQEALAEGLITQDVADANVERILASRDALADVAEQTDAARQQMDQVQFTFESAFESAIFGAEKFSDALKGLLIDLAKLIVRQQVLKPLFEGVRGAFSSASATPSLGASGPTVPQADAFVRMFGLAQPASGGMNLTVNAAPGTSPAQVESAVASGIRVSQGQMLDSRVRGGAFA